MALSVITLYVVLSLRQRNIFDKLELMQLLNALTRSLHLMYNVRSFLIGPFALYNLTSFWV